MAELSKYAPRLDPPFTEEAMRDSSDRLSLALAAARLGTWDWDPRTDLITLCDRAASIFGVSPNEPFTRSSLRNLLHGTDGERAAAANAYAIANRTEYDIEYRVNRPDGTQVWVAANGRGQYDAKGNIVRMLGVVRDITDRKRGEAERLSTLAAMRDSESRFHQLADSMPQIVWSARPDGVLDYYNRRWFEYINLPESAGDAARWDRFIHPDDLDRVVAAWSSALRTGDMYTIEFRVRRADGEYRWFLVRALPIRDENQKITRWFGTCTDTHEQKRLQEQNEYLLKSEREARADAERSSRMKDEFLATLSHELRTPLNAILGWARILRSGATDPDDLAQGLDTIERNARSQTQIIEDLLDMSRIISGKVRLDVRRVDLTAVVSAAIETVRHSAQARGVKLHAALDPLAGPVSGDANRLQQVLWNLLSNAIKFTPKGGRVHVRLTRNDSQVQVSVTDTGEGIKPEFLPHVFERFRQSDSTTTRRHGGLGLGLAIVKQLIELHGGSICVNSSGAGQGATFTIDLPLTPLQIEPDDAVERHPPLRWGSIPPGCAEISGIKVLVVDDEPDARALIKRVLEDCRAVVTAVSSAGEALQQLQCNLPDVLVSDIGMPNEDGHSLIRRVRNLEASAARDIPAIALTAYARSEDRTRAILAGFQMHLAKPVEPTELIAMIASLSGRAGV